MNFPLPDVEPSHATTLQSTVRLLRRFLPGETRGVSLGFGLLLMAAGVALLQPWPLKLVLDSVVGNMPLPGPVDFVIQSLGVQHLGSLGPRLGTLLVLCLGLLLIELLLGALNVLSAYLLNSVALRLVFKLRCRLFDHVQRMSLRFHDARAVGDSLY